MWWAAIACGLKLPLPALEGARWSPSVQGAPAFVSFTTDMYEEMVDDQERTQAFERAIKRRLRDRAGGDFVCLDLGTGPFAVLALFAARAGATKVYAVEANAAAAQQARAFIAAEAADLAPGTIEVIEGFSTTITLPERADLLIAEISGSVASEEGMYASIIDARRRHMKRPEDPASYIPARCQTLAVPAACSVHHRDGCAWLASGPPVRLGCESPWLLPLSAPQLWEDFAFGGAAEALPPLPGTATTALAFRVCAATATANARELCYQLEAQGVSAERAGGRGRSLAELTKDVAHSLSGLACWPRLVLDPGRDEAEGSGGRGLGGRGWGLGVGRGGRGGGQGQGQCSARFRVAVRVRARLWSRQGS